MGELCRRLPETPMLPDFLISLADLVTGPTALAVLATVGLAFVAGARRQRRKAQPGELQAHSPAQSELRVQTDDPDFIQRAAVERLIAKLMLAHEWMEIADLIARWESRLESTPGGVRFHDIAVEICLSGLQGVIDDAPRQSLSDLAAAEVELTHFHATLEPRPDNHILALLTARAHMLVGQACNADFWPESDRRQAWSRMAHHFIAAAELLNRFEPLALMSPLLAEANYLQAQGSPGSLHRLPALFDEWIDLDPANPAIYAAHAAYLARPGAADDDTILALADQALERTEVALGLAGYALFFLPLLGETPRARRLMDPELFAAAILDLASHSATQAEVNWSAAALAAEIETGNPDHALLFKDTLFILLRRHMHVIYPRLWGMPADAVQDVVAEAALAAPDILPELPFIQPIETRQAA
jgi:hypothetical protein